LDMGKIIIRSQFKEIPITESVILRVNQIGSSDPVMLTWTNRRGEDIGNGPLWDAMPASLNASNPSTVAADATEEDDEDVTVAEVDQDDQTTEIDVANNITGVDDAHDVYEQWDEVVPEERDVINHIDDDVQVVTKSTLGGVTTKWDQPLQVSPTVAASTAEVKVSPTDTGRPTRESKLPNPFIPS
jgi:hypothetical protein